MRAINTFAKFTLNLTTFNPSNWQYPKTAHLSYFWSPETQYTHS